jgi:hypothetical protein
MIKRMAMLLLVGLAIGGLAQTIALRMTFTTRCWGRSLRGGT